MSDLVGNGGSMRVTELEAVEMIFDAIYPECTKEYERGILKEYLAKKPGGMIPLFYRALEMAEEIISLKEQLHDEALAFNHANEVVGKLEADIARLKQPVTDEELMLREMGKTREWFDDLLASRSKEPKGATK